MRNLVIAVVTVTAVTSNSGVARAQSSDLTSLIVGQYLAADLDPTVAPKPVCDIAAKVAETATDTALASASLSNDGKLHQYVEVRTDTLKVYKDYAKDIALRILDTDTCTTTVITVRKIYGTAQVRVPVTTRRGREWAFKTEPVALLKTPPGWTMSVVRRANGIEWNNWNTQFAIAAPANMIVIGVKYPIVNEKPAKGQARVTEFINVPYSEALAVPGIIASGPKYVADTMARAVAELRSQGVMSHALIDTLVADIVTKYPAAFPIDKIMPIEHMDLTEFVLDPLWTTNRVYSTIGANGDMFASFTCSPVGACGPQQFMPSSYAMVRRNYPAAALVADPNSGRRMALNSMKAAILLLDLQLTDYIKAFGPDIVTDTLIDELQFAGYNTGTKRVAAVYRIALKKKSPDWVDARGSDCRRPTYRQCLLAETKGYVQEKFRYLRDDWRTSATVAITH